MIQVPLVGAGTIPHRSEAWFKAAGVVLQPAAEGTGVIAGELAVVVNAGSLLECQPPADLGLLSLSVACTDLAADTAVCKAGWGSNLPSML